jgi:cytochrome c-type biogenesis protein
MFGFELSLAVAAFIAGFLMFLAPCTLPLVPGYLAFISGVKEKDGQNQKSVRAKIRRNAVAFVLGFSFVFISFGILAGFFGSFVGQYRMLLSQVGGVFIVIFGLMMLNVIRIAPLMRGHSVKLPPFITPGESISAFLIGSIFALGWTPCVGPVLASVLLIATTKGTVLSGGMLLGIFSLGLAIPFLVTALLYAHAGSYIQKYSRFTQLFSFIGGVFLILIGLLMLFGNFQLFVLYGYQFFAAVGIGDLLDYY